jgi:hypothetical protein
LPLALTNSSPARSGAHESHRARASGLDPLQGFGDNAQLARDIVKAFEQSLVSLEVKGGALRAAKEIYDLD